MKFGSIYLFFRRKPKTYCSSLPKCVIDVLCFSRLFHIFSASVWLWLLLLQMKPQAVFFSSHSTVKWSTVQMLLHQSASFVYRILMSFKSHTLMCSKQDQPCCFVKTSNACVCGICEFRVLNGGIHDHPKVNKASCWLGASSSLKLTLRFISQQHLVHNNTMGDKASFIAHFQHVRASLHVMDSILLQM